jgi:uncharacterized Zn-binding protein involved in type VI secretion
MPGAARQGKDSAGGTIAAGSPDVIVNGSPVARIGDAVSGHGDPPHAGPTMAAGSGTVFANGIPVSRAGDAATCGHPASGSSDVIVG